MSTSKLQKYVSKSLRGILSDSDICENKKPEWLIGYDGTRLELDFYIKSMNLAIEVQGDQHFIFVEFFHKKTENFEKQKRIDQDKKDLCYGAGIELIEVSTFEDADNLIRRIQSENNPEKKAKRKRRKEDIGFQMKERYERCAKNISDYESGAIVASEEKVKFWRDVIKNKGYDSDWVGRVSNVS